MLQTPAFFSVPNLSLSPSSFSSAPLPFSHLVYETVSPRLCFGDLDVNVALGG